MAFDTEGARAAGYSDGEIADELGKDAKFDTAAAREAGYSDAEIIRELQPPRPAATAGDRTQAAVSGVNKGIAYTAGLPVDTGLNALDVGKAALGLGYLGADKINRAFGGDGVDIPTFIRPTRRDNVLGSSQNIEKGLKAVGVQTDPTRPDDAASRYLNLGGSVASGAYFGGLYNKVLPQAGPVVGPPPRGAPPGAPSAGARPPPAPGTPAPLPPAPPPGALGGPPLPAPLGLNSAEQATLAAGERLGMRATPGTRIGSPQLRQIEAKLESYPSTSGPFNAIKADNGRVVQREFLKAIGESGDVVSENSLASAADRIGKVFDDAAANNKIAYDNDLQDALAQIGGRAANELTEAEAPLIQKQLNEILTKAANAGGVIEGPAFQSIYSTLGRLSKNPSGGVKTLAAEARDALHDALIRSAGPKAAQKLTTARDQYRVLVTAEKSGALNPESGTVKAGQLAGAFSRADKRGFGRGYNDSGLYDALRFSRSPSFGPIVGNSGTATRVGGIGSTVIDAVKGIGGNVATRAYLKTPQALLRTGVNAGNATNEIVRQMLGIPSQQALPGIIIGAQPLEDQLRGIYQ